jgi:sodium/proline symporter
MIPFAQLGAIAIYVAILFGIGFWSYQGHKTASDYIIGSRSLNFWLTALAAHASDMSSWLFMGFPAIIYMGGLFNAWFAVGLILFMFLNWLIVAPRVRVQTEAYNSLTFSSFFESHFHDTSGLIRIFTAMMSFVFYTIYISAGIVGLGLLIETLFTIPYHMGITIGIFIIIPYLFIGGYTTLAWLDLFQGLFLMVVIVVVPLIVLPKVGGFQGVSQSLQTFHLSTSLIPNFKADTLWKIFLGVCGWGVGYFGQPHIITKFMGIQKAKQLRSAMAVGMSWQVITMTFATFIGLLAVAYFNGNLKNPELAFVLMVKESFPLMLVAFILCAVLAATISTMDSQILVLASSLSEDIYKRIFRKTASSKELLWISRLFVLFVSAFSFLIAFFKVSSIYSLVFYSWCGLGSSFGPLLLFSLYSKKANRHGAWAGILVGGSIAIVWPLFNQTISPLIPGFLLSCLAIYLVSYLTNRDHHAQAS